MLWTYVHNFFARFWDYTTAIMRLLRIEYMLTRPDNSDFTRFSEGMSKKNGLTRTGHGTAGHTRFSGGYRKVLLITILYGITAFCSKSKSCGLSLSLRHLSS